MSCVGFICQAAGLRCAVMVSLPFIASVVHTRFALAKRSAQSIKMLRQYDWEDTSRGTTNNFLSNESTLLLAYGLFYEMYACQNFPFKWLGLSR